ncbi:MAG: ferrichrome ABC transporter permease, partial [Acidobacteria bacterium]|nr:ferrichrome ABC transporter permease [Acidobacteriota bacterium]
MALYGITIFLSAFLLFLVQPLIGKYILPWYGGTPAVWTACMLFFQALLLGGYLYAHVLRARLSPRRQLIGHAALLLASLTVLPIIPAETWKPAGDQAPLPLILGLLLVTIGVPYFLL